MILTCDGNLARPPVDRGRLGKVTSAAPPPPGAEPPASSGPCVPPGGVPPTPEGAVVAPMGGVSPSVATSAGAAVDLGGLEVEIILASRLTDQTTKTQLISLVTFLSASCG